MVVSSAPMRDEIHSNVNRMSYPIQPVAVACFDVSMPRRTDVNKFPIIFLINISRNHNFHYFRFFYQKDSIDVWGADANAR